VLEEQIEALNKLYGFDNYQKGYEEYVVYLDNPRQAIHELIAYKELIQSVIKNSPKSYMVMFSNTSKWMDEIDRMIDRWKEYESRVC